MPEIVKTIIVKDKEAAIAVMNALAEKYQLISTDPENTLDASNEKLHAYYDSDQETIIIETNHTGSVGEYLEELLLDFPTFF